MEEKEESLFIVAPSPPPAPAQHLLPAVIIERQDASPGRLFPPNHNGSFYLTPSDAIGL